VKAEGRDSFSIACAVTSSNARRATPSAIAKWIGMMSAGDPTLSAAPPATAAPDTMSVKRNAISSGTKTSSML
jgi:hypothetical protein